MSFQDTIGCRAENGELRLAVEPRHHNRSGILHGGVVATLIDSACKLAAGRRASTLSLTISYTGQAAGGEVRAVGRKRGGGSRIVTCTAEVFDAADRLIALGEGSFQYHEEPAP